MLFLSCLTLVFGYAVFKSSAVADSDLNVCLLALGLITVAHGLGTSRNDSAPPLHPWLRWTLLLLPGYVAFQLVPLPLWLLKVLSPARAELHSALAPMVPGIHFAPLSVIPSVTLPQWLGIAGCMVVFLLVREIGWRMPDRLWNLVFPLLLVAGLEAVLGLVQSALGENGTAAHGTYVNRNHFAGLLEMVLPFAVVYPVAILRRDRSRRYFSALPTLKACAGLTVATVILLGIIYSLSRMGFIASLCSLFVTGALGVGAGLSTRKKWIAVGLVGALILLSFVFLPPDQLIHRFAELASGEEISANDRLLMWKETLPLIAAYPLLGCGLGGYESAFLKYSVSSPNSTVDYAHNDYLQLLAELGGIGFAIIVALMLAVLMKALGPALQPSQAQNRFLGLACTGALAAIGLHSSVDFNLYIPANALALAWISGIAAGLEFGKQKSGVRSEEQ